MEATALCLTILVATLTTILIAALITSLHVINDEDASLTGQTLLFRGQCQTASRINLWAHLGINMIATGVLASSNFFMQILVAPTRCEVDRAHASGHWVEIGVQSIRNIRFISRRRIISWLLFSLSSVPLHLVLNGCIIESKASNGFSLLMVAESFLDGAPYRISPVTSWTTGNIYFDREWMNDTVHDLFLSSSQTHEDNWERIHFDDCMRRYNDPDIAMTSHRNVIMVVSNGTSTTGWTRAQVLKNVTEWASEFDDIELMNSLWWASRYHRSGMRWSDGYSENVDNSYISFPNDNHWGITNTLDPVSGRMTMSDLYYRSDYLSMQVQYCLSEKFQALCRLSISNILLLIVCIMCAFKTLLCVVVLTARVWSHEDLCPLITLGDAIASFITRPDGYTKGMCTLNHHDLTRGRKHARVTLDSTPLEPRRWHAESRRKVSDAIPRTIWVLSSLLIVSSLAIAVAMFVQAIKEQSIGASRFSHDPTNKAVYSPALMSSSLVGKTMIANTPQLILSVCYMVYNGFFTRMLTEIEWAKYSVDFRPLRVTCPQGQQRATYRLQLPYRWSLPLLAVSTILHWVYSNCIYVSNYDIYSPEWPYDMELSLTALQYSTLAVLIALLLSSIVALSPLAMAFVRSPGSSTSGASNSAVISAACHCVPQSIVSTVPKKAGVTPQVVEVADLALETLATRPLKWGDVSAGTWPNEEIGHISFGTEDHYITSPIQGRLYY